jgi:hypothetical protein
MDKLDMSMIGKIVTVTAVQTLPKTVKRMTGRFPHEVEVPNETETTTVSVMGRLLRVEHGDEASALWMDGSQNVALKWDADTTEITVEVWN